MVSIVRSTYVEISLLGHRLSLFQCWSLRINTMGYTMAEDAVLIHLVAGIAPVRLRPSTLEHLTSDSMTRSQSRWACWLPHPDYFRANQWGLTCVFREKKASIHFYSLPMASFISAALCCPLTKSAMVAAINKFTLSLFIETDMSECCQVVCGKLAAFF